MRSIFYQLIHKIDTCLLFFFLSRRSGIPENAYIQQEGWRKLPLGVAPQSADQRNITTRNSCIVRAKKTIKKTSFPRSVLHKHSAIRPRYNRELLGSFTGQRDSQGQSWSKSILTLHLLQEPTTSPTVSVPVNTGTRDPALCRTFYEYRHDWPAQNHSGEPCAFPGSSSSR